MSIPRNARIQDPASRHSRPGGNPTALICAPNPPRCPPSRARRLVVPAQQCGNPGWGQRSEVRGQRTPVMRKEPPLTGRLFLVALTNIAHAVPRLNWLAGFRHDLDRPALPADPDLLLWLFAEFWQLPVAPG